jgi:hypothetical protein
MARLEAEGTYDPAVVERAMAEKIRVSVERDEAWMTRFSEQVIGPADRCPICGQVHADIDQAEACPTHGHRLEPVLATEGGRVGWWLSCPVRGCEDGRWLES